MPIHYPRKLVIGTSSRALFDLGDSHQVYQDEGLEAYSKYQIEREDEPLSPGEAFPLVKKLLNINENFVDETVIEIVLLSRNSADTGLRVFNSVEHYGLAVSRAAFCGGDNPWKYISAFGCHLFLSNEANDVKNALDNGVAAATLVSSSSREGDGEQVRFAFDGDAVIFSDEAEKIYKKEGLDAFSASEKASAKTPLKPG